MFNILQCRDVGGIWRTQKNELLVEADAEAAFSRQSFTIASTVDLYLQIRLTTYMSSHAGS